MIEYHHFSFFRHTFDMLRTTVRKRRDPAILDREEQFLKLKIEEIFFSDEYVKHYFWSVKHEFECSITNITKIL